jgi:hypothetical protein
MAIPFLAPIDLNKNELRNARIQNLATAPSSPVEGQVYWDTGDEAFYIWDGAAWLTWIPLAQKGAANGVASLDASSKVLQDPVNAVTSAAPGKIPLADGNGKIDNAYLKTGTGNGLDADTVDGQHAADLLARANHTGTQTASTISDFAATVHAQRIDQLAAPTGDVSFNGQKLTNLGNPTGATDGVNKQYVDNLVQGVDAHPSVRAATTADITRSGLLTIDGVSLANNDRVLVKNQTDPAENGIFVVNSGGAWLRATDADTWAEHIAAFVFVEEGTTLGDTAWLSTVDAGGTLNTTDITWVQFGSATDTTAENIGIGDGSVFESKVGNSLRFRSLHSTGSITITTDAEEIVLDVDQGDLDINTIGGGPLDIANGGTGSTTAADARTALGVPGKFAASVGDGVETVIPVVHNLGTTDVIVAVKEVAGGLAVVYPEIVITDTNTVTVTFTIAPTTNQYRVIVMG